MKPDVIVTWPTGYDYPWWRWQMTQHRKKFGKIFVVFHKMGHPDFRPFLQKMFRNVTYLNMPEPGVNWRHIAVNGALQLSKNPWVLLTEMDFLVKEDYFFVKVFEEAEKCDGVVYDQGERFHPCFTLLRRATIEKTNKYYDPAYLYNRKGDTLMRACLDHGQVLTWELREHGKFKSLKDIGLVEGEDYFHLQDCTHNYDRIKVGDIREMSHPKNFLVYNAVSRLFPVPQCKEWVEITYLAEYLMCPLGNFLNR